MGQASDFPEVTGICCTKREDGSIVLECSSQVRWPLNQMGADSSVRRSSSGKPMGKTLNMKASNKKIQFA